MNEFGTYVRQRREELLQADRRYSLRQVAGRICVEPAYLSKIERGEFAPPSEEVIRKLAFELGENPDILLAMAGKVSKDLLEVIVQRPKLVAELLRQIREMPDHAVLRIVREVKTGNW
jgi:transcriptional regulator with XRE-family HTH domain